MSHIWQSINELASYLEIYRKDFLTYTGRQPRIISTSCPADPVHVGHLECINSSCTLGDLFIVIVNDDKFLIRKKGYAFMPHRERMKIIASIKGVDHVCGWGDDTQFVDGALAIIKPDVFTKGGDRSSLSNIAPSELAICEELGIEIALAVGGSEKLQSSSTLCNKIRGRDEFSI